jgi:hypothetical protein
LSAFAFKDPLETLLKPLARSDARIKELLPFTIFKAASHPIICSFTVPCRLFPLESSRDASRKIFGLMCEGNLCPQGRVRGFDDFAQDRPFDFAL